MRPIQFKIQKKMINEFELKNYESEIGGSLDFILTLTSIQTKQLA